MYTRPIYNTWLDHELFNFVHFQSNAWTYIYPTCSTSSCKAFKDALKGATILISNKELLLAWFCGFFWGLVVQVLLIIIWSLLDVAELKFLVSSQFEINEHKLAFGLYHILSFPMIRNVHILRSYFFLNHPAERLRSLLRVFKGRKKNQL